MKKVIVKQAENFIKTMTLKYKRTGLPVDLTGVSAYCQMRVTPDSSEAVATAECSVSATDGRVIAIFPSEVTASIPTGTYGYDIWVEDDGDAVPILTQIVEVVGRYTQNFSVGGE